MRITPEQVAAARQAIEDRLVESPAERFEALSDLGLQVLDEIANGQGMAVCRGEHRLARAALGGPGVRHPRVLEIRKAASRGERCPLCGGGTKVAGANPDGIRMNYAYDCTSCGLKWEGY